MYEECSEIKKNIQLNKEEQIRLLKSQKKLNLDTDESELESPTPFDNKEASLFVNNEIKLFRLRLNALKEVDYSSIVANDFFNSKIHQMNNELSDLTTKLKHFIFGNNLMKVSEKDDVIDHIYFAQLFSLCKQTRIDLKPVSIGEKYFKHIGLLPNGNIIVGFESKIKILDAVENKLVREKSLEHYKYPSNLGANSMYIIFYINGTCTSVVMTHDLEIVRERNYLGDFVGRDTRLSL